MLIIYEVYGNSRKWYNKTDIYFTIEETSSDLQVVKHVITLTNEEIETAAQARTTENELLKLLVYISKAKVASVRYNKLVEALLKQNLSFIKGLNI